MGEKLNVRKAPLVKYKEIFDKIKFGIIKAMEENMKVITVLGLTGSGKTTVIENIIIELKKRGYSVGSIKQIHNEAFTIDTEGKNTWRHRKAGAKTVTARSNQETDILYLGEKPIYEVLSHYNEDFVVMEGVRDAVVPEITTCKEDTVPEISPLSIAVSGRYSNNATNDFLGIPVIDSISNIKKLVDLIIEKTPNLMMDVDPKCCSMCGHDCRTFLARCLKGERKIEECVLNTTRVSLKINGKEIYMVPFVESMISNVVVGATRGLKGFKEGTEIEIKIKPEK